jgi:hypothetical protein
LVPAFSSKGLGILAGESEVKKILLTAAEWMADVYLISAYDIREGHIPQPRDLPAKPALIILDSGGYEIADDYDLSAISRSAVGAKAWSLADLESVLDAWPPEIPAIFVSYDHPNERKPFEDQVAAARALFKGRDKQLHCFLLKPENNQQFTIKNAISAAIADPAELGSFDVVAITEKELGGSFLDRMVQIARLRRALDEASIRSPIHVFGSLDPVSVCLYYISGAEVFDGLTWIRYAFAEDRCIYMHNHAALAYGIHTRDADLRLRVMAANYYSLMALQERLKDFRIANDFHKLPHPGLLKDASDSLQRKLLKGAS